MGNSVNVRLSDGFFASSDVVLVEASGSSTHESAVNLTEYGVSGVDEGGES